MSEYRVNARQKYSSRDRIWPRSVVADVAGRTAGVQTPTRRSKTIRAVMHCGGLAKKDTVFFEDMICGKVVVFVFIPEALFCQVLELSWWAMISRKCITNIGTVFKKCPSIVDSCIWRNTEDDVIIRFASHQF